MSGSLISTRELSELIESGTLLHIVDGSMCPGEDCRANYIAEHIPGAVFFDQEAIRDKLASHTLALLPSETFADEMKKLGVPNDGRVVVVYDQYSLISAARVWFLFKYYGYSAVSYLDGGLPKWMEEQRRVDHGPPEEVVPIRSDVHVPLRKSLVVKWKQVKAIVDEIEAGTSAWQLWDPRNPSKVHDSVLPVSKRIFYGSMLKSDGCLRPREEITAMLTEHGLDLNKPIIVLCNRGVVSSAAFLILEYLGKTDVKNFLGSWLDWKKHVVDAAPHPQ